jgi:hypothetical protein
MYVAAVCVFWGEGVQHGICFIAFVMWIAIELLVLLLSSTTVLCNTTDVHVVFMNHLDVGYTGTIVDVLTKYNKQYFPTAISHIKHYRENATDERFIYTTHAFLVSMYLDCPVHSGIYCPTVQEIADFKEAASNGEIRWHAFPFNSEPELMDAPTFNFGIEFSKDLSTRFPDMKADVPLVFSQRDVPGLTQAVIPILKKHGVIGITIGVNAASLPAHVPKLFRWRFNQDEILVALHPGGYGGLGTQDCAEILLPETNVTKVLCTAFRGDNQGPPADIPEIEGNFAQVKSEYPEARITTVGGFDEFFKAVVASKGAMDSLPVFNQEMGDNWIYGVASDPLRLAAFRSLQRARSSHLSNMTDEEYYNFSRFMMKNAEHTWGDDVKWTLGAYESPNAEYYMWANDVFEAHRGSQRFANLEASWYQHRVWAYDYAVGALHKGSPLSAAVEAEIKALQAVSEIPVFDETFTKLSPEDLGKLTWKVSGVDVRFDAKTGSVISMQREYQEENWASASNPLGELWYQTFDESDIEEFIHEYVICDFKQCDWAYYDFGKRNVTNAHPKRQDLIATVQAGYLSKDESQITLVLSLPEDAHVSYGAPELFYVKYQSTSVAGWIDVQVNWKNKTTSRMPESIAFRFNPVHQDGEFLLLNKLGSDVVVMEDGSSIMTNGSQILHSVDAGVSFFHPSMSSSMVIDTLDAPVVCLGTPTPFPTTKSILPDYKQGLSFNLFNNLWGTNYIMWYPYPDPQSELGKLAVGENQGFRFTIKLNNICGGSH